MELRTRMMRGRKAHQGDMTRGKYEVIANTESRRISSTSAGAYISHKKVPRYPADAATTIRRSNIVSVEAKSRMFYTPFLYSSSFIYFLSYMNRQ